jgi:two-component system sensor histidine kinase MprB
MSLPVASPFPADEGRWRYRRSLASRVILLTTIAVAMAVAFVAVGAYVVVRMQLQSSLDQSLEDRAESASYELCNSNMRVPAEYLGAANAWVVCIDDAVTVTASPSSRNLPPITLGSPEAEVIKGEKERSIRTIVDDEGTIRWRVVALHRDTGETIILAQSLEDQQSVLGKLGIVMFLFGLVGVIGAGVAGWLVARNGLRPVRRLTSSVETKARTEDLRPLAVEGDDEVARLASAFNKMLIALDASRERQRSLVADAGHELRTPLTSLRTNIDLLSQSDDAAGPSLEPEARAEVLEDIRAQIDELTNLIGDLTELARDEAPPSVVQEFELSEVVHQAFNRVRLRAPALSFDVVAHPWWVTGDAAALERAVTNLLDNAAKWSPPGGRVSCRLIDGVLTVEDDGPGIAEADRPQVFDRFWRAKESRTMPGSGLGLSIVRQVADRHSGTVEVSSSASGGARLTLTIPGSPTPANAATTGG